MEPEKSVQQQSSSGCPFASLPMQSTGELPQSTAHHTYVSYLDLPTLLNLQTGFAGVEREPNETLFIVVHQAFELWFKIILMEIKSCRDILLAPYVHEKTIPEVVHHLRRILEILKLMTVQWKVMETLSPQEFLAFRSALGTASGFQSVQLREIETLLGLTPAMRKKYGHKDPLQILKDLCTIPGHDTDRNQEFVAARLRALEDAPTLLDAINEWVSRTPIDGQTGHAANGEVIDQFVKEYLAAHQQEALYHIGVVTANQGEERGRLTREKYEGTLKQTEEFLSASDVEEEKREKTKRVRAGILFIESYADELPLLAWPRLLLDTIVEIEENFLLFRTFHARMVERMIGRRVGTGGSSGVAYLDSTTQYRIFSDLWAVRSCLLPKPALPPLKAKHFYSFKTEEEKSPRNNAL